MSNKKRISKREAKIKNRSDRKQIDQFVIAFSQMSDKLSSIAIEMNRVIFPNENFGKIGDQIKMQ